MPFCVNEFVRPVAKAFQTFEPINGHNMNASVASMLGKRTVVRFPSVHGQSSILLNHLPANTGNILYSP